MIIAQIPNYGFNKWLARAYVKVIRETVRNMINKYDALLKRFREIYSNDEINKAIDSIQIINGNVFIPTTGINGTILRALEYGTSYMKSYKIISIAVREVLKEGLSDEYKLKL